MFCDRLSLVLLATSCFGAASVLAEDRANFYLNCDGDVEIEAPPGKITSAGPPVTTPVSQTTLSLSPSLEGRKKQHYVISLPSTATDLHWLVVHAMHCNRFTARYVDA